MKWVAAVFFLLIVCLHGGMSNAAFAETPMPLPGPEAQKAALAMIRDVFKEEYAAARTPAEKSALANLFIKKARETSDSLSGRYILLTEAQAIASDAGDCDTMLAAAQEFVDLFKQDSVQVRSDSLISFLRPRRPAAAQAPAIEAGVAVVRDAIANEQFVPAKQLSAAMLAAARQQNDRAIAASAASCAADVRAASEAYAGIGDALKKLESDPADPAANLRVGSYRCFIKADWTSGLPMLAVGSESDIASLANWEKTPPKDANSQVALADRWWSLSEKQTGLAQRNIQARAAQYYSSALPKLAGLNKARVEKRLEIIKASQPKNWIVLLRSSDPSIWNTNVDNAQGYAIKLDGLPDNIKYLRLTCGGEVVYIAIKKDELTKLGTGEVAWQGENTLRWNARQLGIVVRKWSDQRTGLINVAALGSKGFAGWGFGVRIYVNDHQGFCWAGRQIDSAVMEIAVTTSNLTGKEQEFLAEKLVDRIEFPPKANP